MTSNEKSCLLPLEVQDFQFKQVNITQVCGEFPGVPLNRSLITADGKRGLLYIGYENKLIVFKPANESSPEWKLELDVPDRICKVAISCDNSLLAVVFHQPSALIYDANSIHKHTLDVLHEIRLSPNAGSVSVVDLKWNPAIPEILCSITSDHTIGCFQVARDKHAGVQIVGMEKPQGVEALCVSWSPKGKQIVVGCKNGDIIQLKPELKVARHLTAPNPSEGFVNSILWISNYQFCACYYQPSENRISVMIVDAPKGVTAPKYINYEDVTYGSGPTDGLCYYFEHISEWGLIVAASSHSSEVAVLGTADNGTTWQQWLLNDGCSAQLPLNRKKETENYPLGFTVDKSPVQKLPWGPDSTLPNPVPILRILVTSGQLCSYHMVNLKEKAASICSAPTETVAAPQLARPSLGPSEISFNLNANITSTPRSKAAAEAPLSKPKVALNMFGDSSGSSFSFPTPDNKAADTAAQSQQFAAKAPGLFGQGDGKLSFTPPQQQAAQASKLSFTPPVQQPFKPSPAPQLVQPQPQQQPPAQAPPKPAPSVVQKPDANKIEPPKAPTAAPIAQQVQPRATPASTIPSKEETAKEASAYDESLYLRAYYEEQAKFEKELKNRLEPPPSWYCGSDDERELLVKRSDDMDEFLKELRETTTGLASDIAYLKALLLQSFAWLEQGKSRSSAGSDVLAAGRSRSDESKLAELQRRFYYTESQLNQAIKALDLEWAEHNSREATRMAIPKIEAIYQSLLKYSQIIQQERRNLDELAKKWRSISRSSALDAGSYSAAANLDKSMSGLSISSTGCSVANDAAIELRCKLIASSTKSFSRDKQAKLRDLLCESAPRVVRAARPTAVQDRLEATLSSLASAKPPGDPGIAGRVMAKPTKSSEQAKAKAPLSSLGSLVSGIGLSKSPTSSFGAPPAKAADSALQQQLSKPALSVNKVAPVANQQTVKQIDSSFAFTSKQTPTDGSKTTTFSFSSPSATLPSFGSVPKPDNTTIFKLSTKPQASPSSPPQTQQQQQQQQQPTASAFDLSSLMGLGGSKGTSNLASPTPTMSLSFGKSTSPQQQSSILGASQSPGISMFGKSAGTGAIASTSSATVVTTTTTTTAAASAAPSFGLSSMFGALGTSSGASSFSFTPASTAAASSASSTATTTTSISFGSSSASAAASSPSLAALMNFSAASLGTPSSIAASSSPSGNIFSTKTATSSPAAASPMFGAATSTSTTSIFGGATAPITTSTVSKSPSTGTSSLATFGTSVASNFASPTSTGATTTVASAPATAPTNSTVSATSTTANVAPTTTTTSATVTSGIGENSFFKSASAAPATSPTTTTTTSIFGGKTAAASSNSVFGGGASTPTFASAAATATTQQSSIFGASTPTTQSGSIFGGGSSTPLFGATSTGTSAFGAAAAAASSTPAFGTPTTPSTTSAFGATATSIAPLPSFGSSLTVTAVATTSASAFGSPSPAATSTSVFGSPATTSTSATSVFGATAPASTNLFGGTTSSTPFGQSSGSSVFGATATPSTTSSSVFGSASVFGATASTASSSPFGGSGSVFSSGTGSVFGASAAPNASIFGAGTAAASPSATGATSVFGTPAAAPATNNVFGAVSPSQAGGTNLFGAGTAAQGQTAGAGLFGAAAASQPVFGGGAALGSGTSMFGGGSAAASAFGGAPAFGTKPVFGAPAAEFGSAAGFGGAPAFGTPASTGFGSPSMLGGASPLGNTSPNKVFGSNTFEALGAQQGGLTFGSLAQKSPEAPKAQAFQGSSSFSSWR